jgi:hypothetical protein
MDTAEANRHLRKMIADLQKTLRTADRLSCSDEVIDSLTVAINELEDAYIANVNYLNSDNA